MDHKDSEWSNDNLFVMCLIAFAYRVHPEYPLIVAANRDEYYARPTAPAARWHDHPEVYAGRDMEGGGTWMGITRAGRFAALTNHRSLAQRHASPRSRGILVADFLSHRETLGDYAGKVAAQAHEFNGFNLLLADFSKPQRALSYVAPHAGGHRALAPGVYGLSNATLDTPWPKLTRTVDGLKRLLGAALQGTLPEEAIQMRLFGLMNDASPAAETELPDTGIPREWERTLSSPKIISPSYGTRASTIALLRENGSWRYSERSFDVNGNALNTVQLTND